MHLSFDVPTFIDENNKQWLDANAVCDWLDINNCSSAVGTLPAEEKHLGVVKTGNTLYKKLYVSPMGIIRYIAQCKKIDLAPLRERLLAFICPKDPEILERIYAYITEASEGRPLTLDVFFHLYLEALDKAVDFGRL